VSASAESQERWNRWYETAALKAGERGNVETMLNRLDARRFWGRLLMVGSTLFVVGLTTVFYNVLSR
jgi:hypothetical protein